MARPYMDDWGSEKTPRNILIGLGVVLVVAKLLSIWANRKKTE